MTKLTFIDLAKKVLSENSVPMSSEEIWKYAEEKSYTKDLNSLGKTPSATLGARLYVSIKEGESSLISSIGNRPKKFYLKSSEKNINLNEAEGKPSEKKKGEKSYLEKDLHQFIAYFSNLYLKAYCKTINHSKSEKTKFGEWLHPDMVACYFPIEDWSKNALELSEALGSSNVKLYSFELKRELSFSNLRESFFQAVSNSSWANEGYLCAAEISQDEEFLSELKRLSGSFGIGIIKIEVKDPDASEILFPARIRGSLDWDSVNKLCINEDFKDFLSRVKVDITSKEIRKEKYDKIISSEEILESIQKN